MYTVTPPIYTLINERTLDFLRHCSCGFSLSHPVSVSIQLILIINSALVRNLLTLYIVEDLNITHHTARRPLLGLASAVVTVCHLLKAAASTKRPIRLAPQRSYSCLHRQLKWKKKKVTLFFFLFFACSYHQSNVPKATLGGKGFNTSLSVCICFTYMSSGERAPLICLC